VYGASNSGTNGAAGVLGSADRSSGMVYGVYGRTNSATDFTAGVNGFATSSTGITYGVFGATNSTTGGSVGVFGSAGQPTGGTFGVYGQSFGIAGTGVQGISFGSLGTGVVGRNDGGIGVEGHTRSPYGDGVIGMNDSTGVIGALGSFGPGFGGSPTPAAVYGNGGASGWGGDFDDAFASGGFYTPLFTMRIDHPGDPANRILQQAGVQSNELVSMYSGNVTTNSSGDAVVLLPAYVQTLNRDFRYQLTVVGQFAQAIVAGEMQGDQFTIKTDKPGVKVSWQVTGVRQDGFAKTHPLVAEQEKKAGERGYYINPEAFGLPPYPDARLERMNQRAAAEKRP
jgi:hypothetical protein